MGHSEIDEIRKKMMFALFIKFLLIAAATVAMWQGFVAWAFFLLLLGLLG